MTFAEIEPRELGQHYRDVKRRLNTPNPVITALTSARAELASLRERVGKLQDERDFLANKVSEVSAELDRASRAGAQRRAETALGRLENRILIAKKLQQLQTIICARHDLTLVELCGHSMEKKCLRPRHICFYITRIPLNMSLAKVGMAFGGRDHTSIRSGVLRLSKAMMADEQLKDEVDSIWAELQAMPA